MWPRGADHREQLGLVTDPLGEREPVEQRRTARSSLQPDPVRAGLGECEAAVEHLVRRRRPGIIDIGSQHRRQGLVRIGRAQGGDGGGLTWHLAVARLPVFSQDAAARAQRCPFVGPVQDPGPDVGELVAGGCQAGEGREAGAQQAGVALGEARGGNHPAPAEIGQHQLRCGEVKAVPDGVPPALAAHGCVLQCLDARTADVLVLSQRTGQRRFFTGGEAVGQDDGVLQRHLRPRAHRVVRGVGRVPDEHHVLVVPPGQGDGPEVHPA